MLLNCKNNWKPLLTWLPESKGFYWSLFVCQMLFMYWVQHDTSIAFNLFMRNIFFKIISLSLHLRSWLSAWFSSQVFVSWQMSNERDNQCSNMHQTLANLKKNVLCLPHFWISDLVTDLYWQMELRGQLTGR